MTIQLLCQCGNAFAEPNWKKSIHCPCGRMAYPRPDPEPYRPIPRGTRLRYFCNCVRWPSDKVEDLTEMIGNSKELSRNSFLKHVDLDDLQLLSAELGYQRHSLRKMAKDYHIRYSTGWLKGHKVYFFTWSAIEYVFTENGEFPTSPGRKMPQSKYAVDNNILL